METRSEGLTEASRLRITIQPTKKTVTTTTTTETTHTFPTLQFSRPSRPRTLDRTLYPLVGSSIPDEIKQFKLGVGGTLASANVDPTDLVEGDQTLADLSDQIHDAVQASSIVDVSSATKSGTYSPLPRQHTKKRYRDDTPISRHSLSPPVACTQSFAIDQPPNAVRKRQRGLSALESSPRRRETAQGLSTAHSSPNAQIRELLPALSRSTSEQSPPGTEARDPSPQPSSAAPIPLPSPRQSPVPTDDEAAEICDPTFNQRRLKADIEAEVQARAARAKAAETRLKEDGNQALAVLLSLPGMLADFDALPSGMKNYCLYELLRRCEVPNLRFASQVIAPALKRDFIKDLPYEIALKIIRDLDFLALCRVAQVSRAWNNLVDSDVLIWRERLIDDGFEYVVNPMIAAAKKNDEAMRKMWGLVRRVTPIYTPKATQVPSHYFSTSLPGRSRLLSQESPTVLLTERPSDISSAGSGNDDTHLNSIQHRLTSFATPSRRTDSYTQGKLYPDPQKASTSPLAVNDRGEELFLESDDSVHRRHQSNPFKEAYRREYISERSWYSEEPKVISFQGVGTRVITCLQFDDSKIIAGSEDRTIKVYDTETGRLWKNLEGHDGGVWALQYIGNVLVSGSTDRTVKVWDIEEGRCTHTFTGHTSTVRCLQIILPAPSKAAGQDSHVMRMPEWPVIVTGSRDATLRVWRLPVAGFDQEWHPEGFPPVDEDTALPVGKNPYFLHLLSGHEQSVRALSGHGALLASGSYDRSVNVWDLTNGTLVHNLRGHDEKVYAVIMDPIRHQVMSGSLDSRVRIWSLASGECLHDLRGHTSLVGLLDLSYSHLVSAAADGTLRVWDPISGQCIHVLKAHQGAITCFQHSESKIISGSDGTLKLWDLRSGEPIRDLIKDLSAVWQVRFDERRCVAAVERNGTTWFEVLDFGDPDEYRSPDASGTVSAM